MTNKEAIGYLRALMEEAEEWEAELVSKEEFDPEDLKYAVNRIEALRMAIAALS